MICLQHLYVIVNFQEFQRVIRGFRGKMTFVQMFLLNKYSDKD